MSSKMRISADQVAAARMLLGRMTQDELARIVGVSQTTIAMFEAGKTIPYERTVDAIKEALEARGIVFINGDKPGVILDRSKAVVPT